MAAAAPPQPAAANKPAFGAAAPSGVDALADLLAGGDLLGGPAAAQPAPAPYSAAAAAAALAPAAAADPLADLFGPPAPVAAPAAASQGATITAFAKGPLTVTFQLAKQPGSPSHTNIVARYSNSGGAALQAFTLQAAVPKAMQLRLEPATATAVPAYSSGGVSQRLHVTNSLHGQKALVMRLRISYSLAGQQVLEQAEVTTFPPGY
jgi:AP-1 complex subunit gamma-1